MAKKENNLKKFLKSYWLVFVFILVIFLRLPSLFEPFTYGDEGIYLTLGQSWRKGAVFYRDIHDNKPPLLYLLAGVAYSFANYRLILFFWSLITAYFFSKLGRFLFKKNGWAVFSSTLIFAILSSIRLFEGTIANAENFLIGTSILGFYFLLTAKKNYQFFFAGLLFSLSTLFKIPAAFDFAAAVTFGFLLFMQNRRNYSLFIIRYSLFALGFFLPILLSLLYYASQNALSQYLTAAFFQNIPYLASWAPDKPQAGGLPIPLLGRALGILIVFSLLFSLRKRLSSAAKLTTLWFSFSLFAALLSSRPYPHYLLQTIPPLTLSLGLILAKEKEKIISLTMVVVLVFSMVIFNYWHYPTVSYLQNFYSFALNLKTRDDYFAYFGGHTQDLYQVAAYLKTHTEAEEEIFIWSNHPSIYPLAERSPVGRYATAYHIIDFNGYEETIKALQSSLPRYIVRSLEEKRAFPSLEALLANQYLKIETVGQFEIYRHL